MIELNTDGSVATLTLNRPQAFNALSEAMLTALQAELELHDAGELATARDAMRPLAQAFASRFRNFLPLADYPVRTGVHSSTAFAIRMAADWAEAFDPELFALMQTW